MNEALVEIRAVLGAIVSVTAAREFIANCSMGGAVSVASVLPVDEKNSLWGRPKRRFRRTTDSRHRYLVAPNRLQRVFRTAAPNQVWVGGITYVWTSEGWAYLAVVVDLYWRRVR